MRGRKSGPVSVRLRPRWRLRTLVIAALLAALTALLSAGTASADFWPHTAVGTAQDAAPT